MNPDASTTTVAVTSMGLPKDATLLWSTKETTAIKKILDHKKNSHSHELLSQCVISNKVSVWGLAGDLGSDDK
jgi:hypothetical protein